MIAADRPPVVSLMAARTVIRDAQAGSVRANPSSSVYFVAGGDLVKIGTSRYPTQRVREMQTGSPVPLELLATMPGGRHEELRLHHRFEDVRSHGEWFAWCGLLEAVVFVLRQAHFARAAS